MNIFPSWFTSQNLTVCLQHSESKHTHQFSAFRLRPSVESKHTNCHEVHQGGEDSRPAGESALNLLDGLLLVASIIQ